MKNLIITPRNASMSEQALREFRLQASLAVREFLVRGSDMQVSIQFLLGLPKMLGGNAGLDLQQNVREERQKR